MISMRHCVFHIVLSGILVLAGLSPSVPVSAKELLDRVAITVGLEVITEQEIYEQVRITAFLDGKEPVFTQQALRDTADRMVMQRLLLLDMRSNGFPMPTEEEVEAAMAASQKQYWGSNEAFERSTREANLDPLAIRLFLRAAVATLKYVDFRFRPAVRISDTALLERYMQRFPQEEGEKSTEPPAFEDMRDALEAELAEESLDSTMERWLQDARTQAEVRYLPEVIP